MEYIETTVTLLVFIGTAVGLVLYIRSDSRANRQEWRAELAVVVASINGLKDEVTQLNRRVTALEVKVDALDAKLTSKIDALDAKSTSKIDRVAADLSAQMQRNHRELLIRLAFHHHGDGRYPVAPATDPDPVDPAGGDQ